MIKKISPFKFDSLHLSYLSTLKPWSGDDWNKNTKNLKGIKAHIHHELNTLQNNECAYCGLTMWEVTQAQIEHIAPKGSEKTFFYPQFTFEAANLVLACSLCNGSSMKGTFRTISMLHADYNKCEFNIVHPYFDEPNDHYFWADSEYKTIIGDKTSKGKQSIKIFELNSTIRTEARAKQFILGTEKNQELLNNILKFKP